MTEQNLLLYTKNRIGWCKWTYSNGENNWDWRGKYGKSDSIDIIDLSSYPRQYIIICSYRCLKVERVASSPYPAGRGFPQGPSSIPLGWASLVYPGRSGKSLFSILPMSAVTDLVHAGTILEYHKQGSQVSLPMNSPLLVVRAWYVFEIAMLHSFTTSGT